VAPALDRGEVVARPLTAEGKFREWYAAYRARPKPGPHLLAFVDILARYPLPLGRTARERQRVAALLAGR
jgi:hypothetical protein